MRSVEVQAKVGDQLKYLSVIQASRPTGKSCIEKPNVRGLVAWTAQ